MYLGDMPGGVSFGLFNLLDVEDCWKQLACVLDYTMIEIAFFESANSRGSGGPSQRLIQEWSTLNPTVQQLYSALARARLLQACQYLVDKGLISEEYSTNGNLFECSPNHQNGFNNPRSKTQAYNTRPGHQNDMNPPQPYHYNHQNAFAYKPAMNNFHQANMPRFNPYQQQEYSYDHLANPQLAPLPPPAQAIQPQIPTVQCESWSISVPEKLKACDNQLSTSSSSEEDNDLQSKFPKSNMSSISESVQNLSTSIITGPNLPADGFPWPVICKGTNDFSPENIIGKGGFGVVFRLVHDKRIYAVKVLNDLDGVDEEHETSESNLSEIEALFRYQHKNIITMIGYLLYSPRKCIVYEYMANGSLEDRLQCKDRSPPLTWTTRQTIMLDAACGLMYLHTGQDHPLVHGDVKSANILLDNNMTAKLSDFGQAHQVTELQTTVNTTQKELEATPIYGTRAYLPADFFNDMRLTIATDIFGFGVVMFEVCTGQPAHNLSPDRRAEPFLREYVRNLYESPTRMEVLLDICDPLAGNWPSQLYSEILKLGYKCTNQSTKLRPQITDIHKILKKLEGDMECVNTPQLGSTVQSVSLNVGNTSKSSRSYQQRMLSLVPPSSFGSSECFTSESFTNSAGMKGADSNIQKFGCAINQKPFGLDDIDKRMDNLQLSQRGTVHDNSVTSENLFGCQAGKLSFDGLNGRKSSIGLDTDQPHCSGSLTLDDEHIEHLQRIKRKAKKKSLFSDSSMDDSDSYTSKADSPVRTGAEGIDESNDLGRVKSAPEFQQVMNQFVNMQGSACSASTGNSDRSLVAPDSTDYVETSTEISCQSK